MRLLTIVLLFISAKYFCQTTPVQEKVVSYAVGKMGKKVDRGECWDLANSALNFANADWTPPLNFGTKIDHKKQSLQPGDILQFSNTSLKFHNGSMSFPKHTAIVYKAAENRITFLHQNFNNKRYVDTLTINLDHIKSGKIEAFRPKSKE
jgi:hypothetical protein